jgi:hypothetical protein
MIRIIEGKRYNTETATQVGKEATNIGNGASSCTDLHFWVESLYKTKKGKYFLAGRGGAFSRWSESAGQNSWQGGEGIIPLSRNEAYDWAEENLEPEIVISEFSDMVIDA